MLKRIKGKMIKGGKVLYFGIFALEVTLCFFLFFLFFNFLTSVVIAEIGENVTVQTILTIGTSPPEVIVVDIEQGSITLIANSTKTVNCTVEVRDFDGEDDVRNVSVEFFDNVLSVRGDSDDNNTHYTNSSCYLNKTYGDGNTLLAHCTFDVQYYANAGTWNCSAIVDDFSGYQTNASNTTQMQTLLAVGLPTSINYGTVNSTYVSDENVTNVTNFGNVEINLSLSGYAVTIGDGYAMNCTQGSIGNISIENEKFNLTSSTPGSLTLAQFDAAYTNLTTTVSIKEFNLAHRQNDTENEATNATYWRIYVPTGAAGTCSGNIIFGAIQAEET